MKGLEDDLSNLTRQLKYDFHNIIADWDYAPTFGDVRVTVADRAIGLSFHYGIPESAILSCPPTHKSDFIANIYSNLRQAIIKGRKDAGLHEITGVAAPSEKSWYEVAKRHSDELDAEYNFVSSYFGISKSEVIPTIDPDIEKRKALKNYGSY